MAFPFAVNTDWLNKTVNKTARTSSLPYRAVVWHETQNGSGVAANTLKWNLAAKAGSSYDFLISRSGTIYQYLDYKTWTSWDTGVAEWMLDGDLLTNWQLNVITLGIELDGPCDGTPVTPAQIDAAARLALYLHDTEHIPLDRAHQLTHAEIAKHRTSNKRTDPRGYTPEQVLRRAEEITHPPADDWPARWGTRFAYPADFAIARAWRDAWRDGTVLGAARTDEFDADGGRVIRAFAGGYVEYLKATGETRVRVWV